MPTRCASSRVLNVSQLQVSPDIQTGTTRSLSLLKSVPSQAFLSYPLEVPLLRPRYICGNTS